MVNLVDPTTKAVEVASTAAYSIVRDSVFGALLIVSVIGIIYLIRRLLSVQDLRVADQVRANEMMERLREKTGALMEQVTRASTEANSALERLTDIQSDNNKAIGELRATLQALTMTMDSIIRDAVRSRREPSAPPARVQTTRHEVSQSTTAYSIKGPDDERRR